MKGKDTKRKILEAAEELFFVKGYHATGIREIAQRAGVNSAMISYYFGGKENLYKELLAAHLDGMLSQVMKLSVEDEISFLAQFMRIHIETLRARGARLAVLLMRELNVDSPIGREIVEKFLGRVKERVVQVIKRAKEKGILKAWDEDLLFYFILHIDALFAIRFCNLSLAEASSKAFELFIDGAGV